MDLLSIAALLSMGAFAGFAAGLFGIGGGALVVPCMTLLLTHLQFPSEHVVKVAIATSLSAIALTSLASVRAHVKRGAVRWDAVAGLAPGMLLGALLGAQLAGAITGTVLAIFFGLFLCFSALRMLRNTPVQSQRPLPGLRGLVLAGTGIGALSALLGAGGGFLTVPFLSQRQVPIHGAVASSAACGFPIALAGAAGYMWAGRNVPLPTGSVGYVYFPALLCIAIASVLAAPWGARAAHALPTLALKRAFAALLIVLSAYMLIHATMTS